MENLQLKTLPPPQATGKIAPASDPTATDDVSDEQAGFQSLLQRLLGLEASGDAPDTTIAGNEAKNDLPVESPAGAPAAMPLPLPLPLPLPVHPLAESSLPDALAQSTHSGLPGRTAATESAWMPRTEPHSSDPQASAETVATVKNPPRFREHVLGSQPGQVMDLPPGRALESLPGAILVAHPERHAATIENLPLPHFAQGLQLTEPARSVALSQPRIDTPVGTPGWNTEFAQKIVWLAGEKQHSAELHINPPDLGPLNIRLSVDEHQTSAVFTSPHSAVREALEMALPRLREVLAESGITLGNASVTADSPRNGSAFDRSRQAPSSLTDTAGSDAVEPLPTLAGMCSRGIGLVDLFA